VGKEEFRETTLTPRRKPGPPRFKCRVKQTEYQNTNYHLGKTEKQIIQTLSAIKFKVTQNPNGVYVIA